MLDSEWAPCDVGFFDVSDDECGQTWDTRKYTDPTRGGLIHRRWYCKQRGCPICNARAVDAFKRRIKRAVGTGSVSGKVTSDDDAKKTMKERGKSRLMRLPMADGMCLLIELDSEMGDGVVIEGDDDTELDRAIDRMIKQVTGSDLGDLLQRQPPGKNRSGNLGRAATARVMVLAADIHPDTLPHNIQLAHDLAVDETSDLHPATVEECTAASDIRTEAWFRWLDRLGVVYTVTRIAATCRISSICWGGDIDEIRHPAPAPYRQGTLLGVPDG